MGCGTKKGQITVFIIVGIILVSSVILFFVFRSDLILQIPGGKGTSTNAFLSSCLEDDARASVNSILKNGGYVESPFYASFKFDKEIEKISYLCYNQEDYLPCVNQQPALLSRIEDEIKKSLKDKVENCFSDMTRSFEDEGYEVSSDYNGFEVILEPKKILIRTDSDATLTKAEESSRQENFEITILTRLYELTNVAQEIVNKETTNCDFAYRGYELFYPQFEIEKIQTEDSSDIYKIKHEDTGEEFRFAVRGCVIPPGI
ncbi:MAG TPA: hypothetical protein VJ208_01650 [Candidatus Nanoarchaeia archaeon]|nr:hypothetical protein [Candidatus Nanoarchaeia archaeon]